MKNVWVKLSVKNASAVFVSKKSALEKTVRVQKWGV